MVRKDKNINIYGLNKSYSTTRLITTQISKTLEDHVFKVFKQLPPNVKRKAEGGLRTKGCFKKSIKGKPLISVITVLYNAEEFVEKTIISVISQTYDNVEYIIIDGGSDDKTLEIIKKFDNLIDYWVSEPDDGIFDAMNKAIDLANGDWLNFLNAGDKYINKEILSKIKEMLGDDQSLYGFSFNEQILLGKRKYQRTRLPKNIIYNMPTCHNAMFFPKNQTIKYRLEYEVSSDYNYFREYIERGYIFRTSDFLAVAWLRGGFSDKRIFRNIKDRLVSNFKYKGKSLFPLYSFIFYLKEYFVQALKRFLPMNILNLIRRITNFEYTEVDD